MKNKFASSNLSKGLLHVASAMLVSSTLVACGQGGFQSAASSGGGSNSGQGSGGSGGGAVNPLPTLQSVAAEMNSSPNGGSYAGTPMIEVNAVNQTLELILPIPSIGTSVTPIVPTGFNGLNGVSVGPTLLPDGSEAWMISVPLSMVLNGAVANPTFNALPNGNPLPYFPSQEVSGLSVSLPSRPGYSVTLYIGVKAVAAFVGIPGFQLPIGFGVNVVNQTKTRNIGYLALIPSQGAYPAGVYLAAQIPTDLAALINSVLVTH